MIVDRVGKIVGLGSNHVVANFAPTWHGEMDAMRRAIRQPISVRSIPERQMLRDEAVKVWKECAAQPGNVPC